MRTTLLALVSCTLLVLSQGAPAVKRKEESKRCCQPAAPNCFNPCPPAVPDFSFVPPPPVDPCCAPGPTCANPCAAAPPPPPPVLPPPPPPQVPLPPPTDCCAPGLSCANPCAAAPPPTPLPMGGFDMGLGGCCDPMLAQPCANPCAPPPPPAPAAYAPYPGEITMKLQQTWDPDKYLDHTSPGFQILAGNLKNAVQAALAPRGMPVSVTNVYFREGYVPGNPSTMPKVVAHFMVNQNSDAASLLEAAVTPDGTLGDGLKVYKDSFNAY